MSLLAARPLNKNMMRRNSSGVFLSSSSSRSSKKTSPPRNAQQTVLVFLLVCLVAVLSLVSVLTIRSNKTLQVFPTNHETPFTDAELSDWRAALNARDVMIEQLGSEGAADAARLSQLTGGDAVPLVGAEGEEHGSMIKATTRQASSSKRREPPPPPLLSSECALAWSNEVPAEVAGDYGPVKATSPFQTGCFEHYVTGGPRCYLSDLLVVPAKMGASSEQPPAAPFSSEQPPAAPASSEQPPATPGAVRFFAGAFRTGQTDHLPRRTLRHGWYINKVLLVTERASKKDLQNCDDRITLFLARYSHGNLFHALTELWNVYFSLPRELWEHPDPALRLYFLDSHPRNAIDELWENALPLSLPPTQILDKKEKFCVGRAIFVTPGAMSALWEHDDNNWKAPPCPDEAENFVDHVLWSYGILSSHRNGDGTVLIIDVPSPTSPHVGQGPWFNSLSSHYGVSDADAVAPSQSASLHRLSSLLSASGALASVVDLGALSLAEQLARVRAADVIIGWAGEPLLSHVLLMSKGATLVELDRGTDHVIERLAHWREGQVASKRVTGGKEGMAENQLDAIVEIFQQAMGEKLRDRTESTGKSAAAPEGDDVYHW